MKAALAWRACAQETMNRAELRCGLSLMNKNRSVAQSKADAVFKHLINLQQKNGSTLAFPAFVLACDA